MKINFFKKENTFKKKDFIFNPNLYWELTICGTFIIILSSFFFGYRLFMQINQEPVLPIQSGGEQVPTVDKNRLTKVLDYFSGKEQKSAEILNAPPSVIDPSL